MPCSLIRYDAVTINIALVSEGICITGLRKQAQKWSPAEELKLPHIICGFCAQHIELEKKHN